MKLSTVFTAVTVVLIGGVGGAAVTQPLWATDKEDTTRVVENAGLTVKTVGGYAWFQCGKDDTFATKFIATNKDGKEVEGAVCKGLLFKGSTIRYK